MKETDGNSAGTGGRRLVGLSRNAVYRRRYSPSNGEPCERVTMTRMSPASSSASKCHVSYPPGAVTRCQPSGGGGAGASSGSVGIRARIVRDGDCRAKGTRESPEGIRGRLPDLSVADPLID